MIRRGRRAGATVLSVEQKGLAEAIFSLGRAIPAGSLRPMTAAKPGERCAQISRALDEPMAGTAPSTRRWLCLERPAPWPADITHDRDPAVPAFLARAATAGLRPLLLRGPEPVAERRPTRIVLADTAPGTTAVTALAAEDPGQLEDLPLPACPAHRLRLRPARPDVGCGGP
jgi:hypothetical protein